jgi:hypothetical protein
MSVVFRHIHSQTGTKWQYFSSTWQWLLGYAWAVEKHIAYEV